MAKASLALGELVGGVEELRKALPEGSAPCYGMLRLTVGEGTFARDKLVMLTFLPDALPGMKRAKAAAKKAAAAARAIPKRRARRLAA